jgi:hypothetical protein
MPIRAKPKQQSSEERRIDALIEKGGTVATSEDEAKLMSVQLRLMPDLIQRIDRIRKRRMVPPSRHAWILEALLEKLEKDK